jgi:hypothetical protein
MLLEILTYISIVVFAIAFWPFGVGVDIANRLSDKLSKFSFPPAILGFALNVLWLWGGGIWISKTFKIDGWIIFWSIFIPVVLCGVTMIILFFFSDGNEKYVPESGIKVK